MTPPHRTGGVGGMPSLFSGGGSGRGGIDRCTPCTILRRVIRSRVAVPAVVMPAAAAAVLMVAVAVAWAAEKATGALTTVAGGGAAVLGDVGTIMPIGQGDGGGKAPPSRDHRRRCRLSNVRGGEEGAVAFPSCWRQRRHVPPWHRPLSRAAAANGGTFGSGVCWEAAVVFCRAFALGTRSLRDRGLMWRLGGVLESALTNSFTRLLIHCIVLCIQLIAKIGQ